LAAGILLDVALALTKPLPSPYQAPRELLHLPDVALEEIFTKPETDYKAVKSHDQKIITPVIKQSTVS